MAAIRIEGIALSGVAALRNAGLTFNSASADADGLPLAGFTAPISVPAADAVHFAPAAYTRLNALLVEAFGG